MGNTEGGNWKRPQKLKNAAGNWNLNPRKPCRKETYQTIRNRTKTWKPKVRLFEPCFLMDVCFKFPTTLQKKNQVEMCKTRVMLTVMLKSFFSCFHQSTPYHIVVITCNVVHLLRWFEVGIVLLNEKHAELCRRQRCRMSVFFSGFSLIYIFVEGFNLMWVPLFGLAKVFESQIRTTSCGHAAYMIGYDGIQLETPSLPLGRPLRGWCEWDNGFILLDTLFWSISAESSSKRILNSAIRCPFNLQFVFLLARRKLIRQESEA